MMIDLSYMTLIGIFLVPILIALVISMGRQNMVRWLLWFQLGWVSLGLVILGLFGETEVLTGLFFMGEQITFSITLMPVVLFLTTLIVLAVMHLGHEKAGHDPITRYQGVLLSLSISSGALAFFSGQFMIRYIAIDVVGLLAALTVLSSFGDIPALKSFIIIFQVLRLGDLSLLASILLINHYTGTLDISEMITGSLALPLTIRTWIFFGFLLALLIKLAIWPFGLWIQKAGEFAKGSPFWISGILTPALGYYLLYRVLPIVHSEPVFENIMLASGLALFLLILLIKSLRLVRVDRFTHMSGLSSCFLLAIFALESSLQGVLIYLVGLLLYRLAIAWPVERQPTLVKKSLAFLPLVVNVILIGFNFGTFPPYINLTWLVLSVLTVFWDLWAIQQGQPEGWEPFDLTRAEPAAVIEHGTMPESAQTRSQPGIQNSVYRLGGFLRTVADWVYENIEMRLDSIWDLLGEKLLRVSELTWQTIEVGAVEKSSHLVDDALRSLQAHERNVLKRSLRYDLAWIPLLLVILLIMLRVF